MSKQGPVCPQEILSFVNFYCWLWIRQQRTLDFKINRTRIFSVYGIMELSSIPGHKRHSTPFSASFSCAWALKHTFFIYRYGRKLIFLLGSSGSCISRFWYIFEQLIQLSPLVERVKLIEASEELFSICRIPHGLLQRSLPYLALLL